MYRNAVARRYAHLTRPTPWVVANELVTVRRRPNRRTVERAAITVSRYGYDW